MLALNKSEGGYECKMNCLLGRERFLEYLDAIEHFCFLFLVNREGGTAELHLAEVYDIVISQNQKVYLCPRLLFCAGYIPGRERGSDSTNFQCSLYLRYMLPANLKTTVWTCLDGLFLTG